MLQWQAEAAQEVLDRRKRRKHALQCLEADVQRAKQKLPTMSTNSDKEQRVGYMAMMEERLALLNTAITTAKAAEVPVVQAKRVLAEMEGQLLAVEAGEQLEAALACKDKDLASLKVSFISPQLSVYPTLQCMCVMSTYICSIQASPY